MDARDYQKAPKVAKTVPKVTTMAPKVTKVATMESSVAHKIIQKCPKWLQKVAYIAVLQPS